MKEVVKLLKDMQGEKLIAAMYGLRIDAAIKELESGASPGLDSVLEIKKQHDQTGKALDATIKLMGGGPKKVAPKRPTSTP